MVSGYLTSTILPRVDGLSTDPRVLGRHKLNQFTYLFIIFSIILKFFDFFNRWGSWASLLEGVPSLVKSND